MAKRTIPWLLIALIVALAPGRIPAQGTLGASDVLDMNLEDLMKLDINTVSGVSGYRQQVSDATAAITIVTADEIKRYGYRTLADILRNVPGFYVTYDRVSSYLGERGFGRPGDYNGRILVLVDGHRMNDNVDGGVGLVEDFPIDVDLFDRVEIIRGPNSSTYIASALLGVINVVTKRDRDARGLVVSGEAASYGTYKTRLAYGHQFSNGLGMLLSGSYLDSQGPARLYFKEFDNPATNNGVATNADGARANHLFAKLSYRNLIFEGGYGDFEQYDPTASYGTIFNAHQERIGLRSGYLDLSYDHHFGGDWGYQGRVSYDNGRYHGVYPDDMSSVGGGSHVLNEDFSHGQDGGISFAISKRLPGDQTLIVGSEYRNNFQQGQRNYDVQPYYQYLASRQRSSLWGVYLQDTIPLRRNLILNLGLSYDHYSTFGGTSNPRAALIYQPWEETTIKLLYGQSFRAPTAFETYYAIPDSQEANPSLRPETTRTTELVWEQSFPKSFALVVSGYYYPVRGVIIAGIDPVSGSIIYENSNKVDLKGAEFTLKRQSRSGVEAGLSLSLERATSPGSEVPLSNSPHVLTQVNLSAPLFRKKLFASMDLQYVSKRTTAQGGVAEAYVVPNFTLFSPNALKRWEISASVYNAFDKAYGDPASVAHQQDILPQDGRNYRLKFLYHF